MFNEQGVIKCKYTLDGEDFYIPYSLMSRICDDYEVMCRVEDLGDYPECDNLNQNELERIAKVSLNREGDMISEEGIWRDSIDYAIKKVLSEKGGKEDER